MPHHREPDATIAFRPIEPADDATIESIVRAALESFDCTGEGSSFADAELESMSAAYPGGEARYFVVEVDGVVRGGGGFCRLQGTATADGICELRKMYLEPGLRGQGVGRRLLAFLLDEMRAAGFARAYLETMTQMAAAQHLYGEFGFVPCDAPMGRTGHRRCDRRFHKPLYEHGIPS